MTIPPLTWSNDLTALPFERPVLIRPKASDRTDDLLIGALDGVMVPVMAVRHHDDDDAVDLMLGGDASGYGWRLGFERIEAWMEVLAGPSSS